MADIYLKDLVYDKPEIDSKLTSIDNDIVNGLALKINSSDRGSPGGVATLDGTAKVPHTQLPLATQNESVDPTNDKTVMTPSNVDNAMLHKGYLTEVDASNTYGDLRSDGSVIMSSSYNPQLPKSIATVDFVQSTISSTTTTRVIDTLAEMFIISEIIVGDITFITADPDPTNDGEYLCVVASSNGSNIGNWVKRQTDTAWGTLIGTLSDQTDLQVELDLKEDKTVVDSLKTDVVNNADNITQNTIDIATLVIDVADNDTNITTNADAIAINKTNIATNTTDIAAIPAPVQSIDELNDVDITTTLPKLDNPLRFDGTNFVADGRDLLASGLAIENNIKFINASSPTYEGMTVQMGINGLLSLVNVPQQAHIQEDLHLTDTFVQTTPQEFWRITADISYSVSDSDSLIHAVFDNNSGTDRQITFTFKINGTAVESKTYTVWGDSTSQEITLTQAFGSNYDIDDIFTVEMSASRDDDIRILGTLQNGIFRLRKTDTTTVATDTRITSLETQMYNTTISINGISDKLNKIGEVISTSQALGNSLDRAEIEQSLTTMGYTLPLTYDKTFFLVGIDGKVFEVKYIKGIDWYAYEKLTVV